MPEQPQRPERTLDMPAQDPWAEEPTAPAPPTPAPYAPPGPPQSPFSRGRARVDPGAHQQRFVAEHEPTGVGWPGAEPPAAHRGMSWRWSELRRGSEWTNAAVLFAFVCWGIWALSDGGPLLTPVIVFLVTLAVAVGVFCLARIVGYLVLERQFGRVRRSARGSHLVTALFLVGVGVADLQQTEWVMTAFHWVAGQVN
jgi:hypothetical protein